MRLSALALGATLLLAPLSGCVTVSPYGYDAKTPTPEAVSYAESLLARPSESLTDEEVAFLSLYAQQAEARNTQAQAEFMQTTYLISTGLSVLSIVVLLIERAN